MWRATLILPIVLVSGCAARIDGDYCDIARPLHFGDAATVSWLMENDRPLLRDTVAHNEVHRELCDG